MPEPGLSLLTRWQNFYVIIFIGIRNAWDSITYLAIEQSQPEKKSQD